MSPSQNRISIRFSSKNSSQIIFYWIASQAQVQAVVVGGGVVIRCDLIGSAARPVAFATLKSCRLGGYIQTAEFSLCPGRHLVPFKRWRKVWSNFKTLDGSNSNSQTRHLSLTPQQTTEVNPFDGSFDILKVSHQCRCPPERWLQHQAAVVSWPRRPQTSFWRIPSWLLK